MYLKIIIKILVYYKKNWNESNYNKNISLPKKNEMKGYIRIIRNERQIPISSISPSQSIQPISLCRKFR